MSLATTINAFIKQSIREQRIPFEITMNANSVITFPTKDELDKAYDDEFKKHSEVYKK